MEPSLHVVTLSLSNNINHWAVTTPTFARPKKWEWPGGSMRQVLGLDIVAAAGNCYYEVSTTSYNHYPV